MEVRIIKITTPSINLSFFIFFRKRIKKVITTGVFSSTSQSAILLCSAAAFRFAGYLVQKGEMEFDDVLK